MALSLLKTRSPRACYIERAATQTVELEPYVGDTASATTPTSGTYTLRDTSGTTLGSVATLTTPFRSTSVAAATVPATLDLGEGYSALWSWVISGETFTVLQPVSLVLRRVYCPITNADILERHPEWTTYPASASSWEVMIRQAHALAERRLISAGRFPYLVLNSDALYEPELYWALSMIARHLSTYVGDPERYTALAAFYDERAEQAWGRVTLTYDADEDGIPDESEQGATADPPVIFLSDTPTWWW